MAIDFPNSPSTNDTYTVGNKTWIYDGSTWNTYNTTSFSAETLPGTTLKSTVTGSSLTSVGTLTNLSVTGDVAVDTNVLKVDTANNRVGINVTSPTSVLDVIGNEVIREAATQDGIQLAGRAGGTGSLTAKLIPTTLTTNRTLTLPDETGTLATTNLVPAGCVMQYSGASAPTGWLLCDGSAVSRTTYASLFAVLSTTYGSGNGSTTFNIPNLQGRVPVGKDAGTFSTLGGTGGAETVTLTSAQSGVPAHSHGISDPGHTHTLPFTAGPGGGSIGYLISGVVASYPGTNSATTGITVSNNTAANAASAHTNLQPYLVLNYIIKT